MCHYNNNKKCTYIFKYNNESSSCSEKESLSDSEEEKKTNLLIIQLGRRKITNAIIIRTYFFFVQFRRESRWVEWGNREKKSKESVKCGLVGWILSKQQLLWYHKNSTFFIYIMNTRHIRNHKRGSKQKFLLLVGVCVGDKWWRCPRATNSFFFLCEIGDRKFLILYVSRDHGSAIEKWTKIKRNWKFESVDWFDTEDSAVWNWLLIDILLG